MTAIVVDCWLGSIYSNGRWALGGLGDSLTEKKLAGLGWHDVAQSDWAEI